MSPKIERTPVPAGMSCLHSAGREMQKSTVAGKPSGSSNLFNYTPYADCGIRVAEILLRGDWRNREAEL